MDRDLGGGGPAAPKTFIVSTAIGHLATARAAAAPVVVAEAAAAFDFEFKSSLLDLDSEKC